MQHRSLTARLLGFALAFTTSAPAIGQEQRGEQSPETDETPKPRVPKVELPSIDIRPIAPPLEPNLGWINAPEDTNLDSLRGHVVVIDFWTAACINCHHVLPDLEAIENRFAGQPVIVLGVHSAKFTTEGLPERVLASTKRLDIHHPVIVDDGLGIMTRYAARAWPTFVVLDGAGRVVGHASGEGNGELLIDVIEELLLEGAERGELVATPGPLAVTKLKDNTPKTPTPGEPIDLNFPGKVAIHAESGVLAIADSSNDRIIIASIPDADGASTIRDIYGKGRGATDGGPRSAELPARFHDPQGLAFNADGTRLWIADNRNHTLREIDLMQRRVKTIAGLGFQGRDYLGGAPAKQQAIASPWALALDEANNQLIIAMAGTHQLWSLDFGTGRLARFAGTGREAIYDGPAELAQLAQPSGLSIDANGRFLYVADTEGSAIRRVDLRDQANTVRTIVGRAIRDPEGADRALFDFGDRDGLLSDARLQKAIGVAAWPGDANRVLVLDSYNDALKLIELEAGTINRLSLSGMIEPNGLVAVAKGDGGAILFIADTGSNLIRRVELSASAEVTADQRIEFRFPNVPIPEGR